MLRIDKSALCSQLGANVSVETRPDGIVMLDMPFCFPDGDHYPIYLEATETGGIRVSDGGHTLMRLSYENDIDKFLEGIGKPLISKILSEKHVEYDEIKGAFYVDTSADCIADAVSRLVRVIQSLWKVLG